jgi:hypothetical protein
MPNVRAKGQKLICFAVDQDFLSGIDAARGGKTRSQFVREAIFRELTEIGIRLNPKIIFPPDRAGVIQFVGNNNRNITQRAAEAPPKHRTKKGKKK